MAIPVQYGTEKDMDIQHIGLVGLYKFGMNKKDSDTHMSLVVSYQISIEPNNQANMSM